MTDKFQNKYRTLSHRKPNWDYSANGMYFITIVTQHRECNLGTIENNEMVYSDFGKIVHTEWCKSFEIRNELILDEYIIMPNHLHGIIILNSDKMADGANVMTHVETHGSASLQQPSPSTNKQSKLIRLPKSISSFIAGFKSAVNSKIDDYIDEHQLDIPKYNKNNHFFQPNYHDHIIQNDKSFQTISNYIVNNPLHWVDDKLNNHKNL